MENSSEIKEIQKQKQEEINNNDNNDLNEFIHQIDQKGISKKLIKEESKNSSPIISKPIPQRIIEPNIPLNLKYSDNYIEKNKFSQNITPKNILQELLQKLIPGAETKNIFSSNFFENCSLSYFVPITISCSLETNTVRRERYYKEKEKKFFEKIIKIAEIFDMKEFWSVFQHIKKPTECPISTDYHVFKKGIIPMWEDPLNKNGGKLTVLLTPEYANVIWEEVIFNFAKGVLPYNDYINGIVIAKRPMFFVLSFWIKTTNSAMVNKIKYDLAGMLMAPSINCFDFIPFN